MGRVAVKAFVQDMGCMFEDQENHAKRLNPEDIDYITLTTGTTLNQVGNSTTKTLQAVTFMRDDWKRAVEVGPRIPATVY